MDPFATSSDLASRWPTLPADQHTWADVLLADASILLRSWFPDIDARILNGSLDAGVPLMVVCSMVKRAMINADKDGASQVQETQTMGPFSATEGTSYRNPEGNLYLTDQERDLIAGLRSRAYDMTSQGM